MRIVELEYPLELSKYQQIDPIEKVIKKEEHYNVVRKNHSTPEPNSALKKTDIDNS
jgi:hypothetical protein